mgnify:CR=1 FL=1
MRPIIENKTYLAKQRSPVTLNHYSLSKYENINMAAVQNSGQFIASPHICDDGVILLYV